ncbi:MAG: GNAT family N-acetyltransferase [Clostridia bacterium]|nr:GNAT family N-acetyltransferase [Clostridia bacterium]
MITKDKEKIETERLVIREFTHDMAQDVHENSLDEDNRRFVPDEVFDSVEEAQETVDYLIGQYGGTEGPFVYPVLLRSGENIGYVQLVPVEEGWEIGYHIAKKHTGKGYATEAVRAFLPAMAKEHGLSEIFGICLAENAASVRVMEKCGFLLLFRGRGQYQGEERDIVRNIWKSPVSVSVQETVLTQEALDTLIRLSADWEAEQSCYGYRKNEKADIEGNRIFLAKDQGKTVGYLFGRVQKSEKASSVMPDGTPYFEVEELYVRPEYRSRGIGRSLFACAEKAVADEAEYLMLSTATKNWKAIFHFYLDELDMSFWNARLFKKISRT